MTAKASARTRPIPVRTPKSARKLEAADTASPRFYRGDAYVVDDSFGYLVRLLNNSIHRHIEQRMQTFDLTAMQWGPLMLLAVGKGDTAASLARCADMDTGAMTRMLDRLEAKGLIRRKRSKDDRRVVHLELTADGEEAVQHVPYVLSDVLNLHLRDFSAAELRQLLSFLRRLIAAGRSPKDDAS